jgi:hypothetical protein
MYAVVPIMKIDNAKLAVKGGQNVTTKTFKWFKDGAVVATIVGDSTYTPTKDGRYSVQITDSEDTMVVHFSKSAIKRGDSLILESNTRSSSTTFHYTIPHSFAVKRDRGGMVFHHPNSFVETGSSSDGVAGWDYALTGLGKEDTGIEIRYKIQPIDTASKTFEEKLKAILDANNPVIYKAYLTNIANKVADKTSPLNIKEIEPANLKDVFNADWGATVMVDPCLRYGGGFKHCYIVAIHKNNVGDAYYIYMLQGKQFLESILKKTLGTLKFK